MAKRLDDIRRVFDEVHELPAAEREAALDRLCDGDPILRGEVESLLQSHGTEEFLGAPTVVAPERTGEGAGTVIGAYKLLQLIGEGGFGAVYMAEQERPVRRKVALKIIKLGMDTRQVIARFEAERQALAMMDHPNIAKVLDAGATETGRPYFVMELVRGVPITEYCDTNKVTTRERLDLFMQVCHAVQHAHQKGVIHRDIKPSNVLVTLHDGRPVPKVIDFGIAKATSQRLTDKTLFTEFRQFIGTPEYMSPEQAEMSGLDVDTRSDIYSLGVLLYELLTGTTPFDAQTLRNQPLDKIQRLIRETEPPRPSTRLDTMAAGAATGLATGARVVPGSGGGSTLADVARLRRTDPAGLGRLLKGDLDWIVMRAIEKDRTRRYETATALAGDVQRYLEDKPVEAGPPSTAYRMRKFVKRNRLWLMPTAIGAAAFAVSFVGVVYGLVEARRGRDAAEVAQQQAETARGETQAALERARREADRNRAVGEYLQDAVSATRGSGSGAEVLPLEEVLTRGRGLFGGDHAVIASALLGWASARQLSGDARSAELAIVEAAGMFERLHGADDPRVTNARLLQARAIEAQSGRESEAGPIFRAVVQAFANAPGVDSPEYAAAALALTKHTIAHAAGASLEETERLWRESIRAHEAAFGEMDRRTIQTMGEFGIYLQRRGRTEACIPVLTEAVRRGDEAIPEGDLTMFYSLNSLILADLTQSGQMARAAGNYDRLITMAERMEGEFARATVSMWIEVAGLHAEAGDEERALARLETFVESRDRTDHEFDWTDTIRVESGIVMVRPVLDRHPDLGRRVQLARAAGVGNQSMGFQKPPATILSEVAAWLVERGFSADAEGVLERVVALRRGEEPQDRARLGRALAELGRARLELADAAQPIGAPATPDAAERWARAEAPIAEALSIMAASDQPDEIVLAHLRCGLAQCRAARGRVEEAADELAKVTPTDDWPASLAAAHRQALERLVAARDPG